MFPLWFAFLGGSFAFLGMGPSILYLVFPFFGVLWLIHGWHGFINHFWGLIWPLRGLTQKGKGNVGAGSPSSLTF
jgi:hypothetical protein